MKPTSPTVNFFINVLNELKSLLTPNGFSNLKYQHIVIDKSSLKQRLNDIAKGHQRM
ncbi:MAG: hypothetical protein ABI315_11315 [Bacteroidia bacterium]